MNGLVIAILGLVEEKLCPMYPKGTLSIYANIFTFRDEEVSNLPARPIGMKCFRLRTTGMSTFQQRNTYIYIGHIYICSLYTLLFRSSPVSLRSGMPASRRAVLSHFFSYHGHLMPTAPPLSTKHPSIGSKHALPYPVYCPVYALYCVDRINYSSKEYKQYRRSIMRRYKIHTENKDEP